MADTVLYAPDGSEVSVADTPSSYVTRLVARGYTVGPPAADPYVAVRTIIGPAARTASDVSGFTALPADVKLMLAVEVTAHSGTSPTLDVTVEWFLSQSGQWYESDPDDGFSVIVVDGKWLREFTPKSDAYRVRWVIGGTATPSFTFAVLEAVR